MLTPSSALYGELYTPADIAERARNILGGIDLDPASDATGRSCIDAAAIFTADDDGLSQPWHGTVWLFPPSGRPRAVWVGKLLHEYRLGRVTAALFYDAFDARAPWFQHIAREASICFPGPLRALSEDGTLIGRSRHGALFCYLGPDAERFEAYAGDLGAVLHPRTRR